MDLNFHLLKSDQILLLQNICLKEFINLEGFSTFRNTRDNVDVVILDDSTGYGEYYRILDKEEQEIREKIKEELERRQGIEGQEEEREERPKLPNFDNPESEEPSIFDWEEEDLSNNHYFTPLVNDNDEWLADRGELSNSRTRSRIVRRRECAPWSTDTRIFTLDIIEEMRSEYMSDDADLIFTKGLNNFQLKQLDNKIGEIKWNRARLRRSCDNRKNGTSTYWSGTMLGCYCVERDLKGKVISRTIFLFLDSIRDHAKHHPLTSWHSVNESNILAEVFVHEMFHAYFQDIKSKDFIVSYLRGIREIEEAMAEYAMLAFLKNFDKTSFDIAEFDVNEKLISGDPQLQCYGMGKHLFDNWYGKKIFDRKILSIYQKIQPSPRTSIRLVRSYINSVRTRHPMNRNRCMRALFEIIDYFNTYIPRTGIHYHFRGSNYGYSNEMVREVLKYYISHTGNSLAKMKIDFEYANAMLYGSRPIFEETAKVAAANDENSYDLREKLALPCGAEIVVLRAWESKISGKTQNFLYKLKHLCRTGILDENVRILK